MPPSAKVEGRTQAEWSRLWWQWAFSFQRHESPVADQTGELCARKQSGKVWFLAGTYGTRRTVRTCTVPSGTYLFFPMINYVVYPSTDIEVSCEHLRNSARRMTEDPRQLVVELDGIRVDKLETFRQATPDCFNLSENRTGAAPLFPSAADGYYVMLRPLTRGRHELNFGGILPNMAQAVPYTLLVE